MYVRITLLNRIKIFKKTLISESTAEEKYLLDGKLQSAFISKIMIPCMPKNYDCVMQLEYNVYSDSSISISVLVI